MVFKRDVVYTIGDYSINPPNSTILLAIATGFFDEQCRMLNQRIKIRSIIHPK
jgi:hypothetical protein